MNENIFHYNENIHFEGRIKNNRCGFIAYCCSHPIGIFVDALNFTKL